MTCFSIFAALLMAIVNWPAFGAPSTNTPNFAKPSVTNSTLQGGIRGQVIAGPISPVQRPGHPNSRPLAGAVVLVLSEGGKSEIARGQADEHGRFAVPLPKGRYWLGALPAQSTSGRLRGKPQIAAVESNKFTQVSVRYDTGIR